MNTDTVNNPTDKHMNSQEKKDDLRRSLKAKINASKIRRLSKNAKQNEMIKIKNQVQKELGDDYDLNNLLGNMLTQKL